MAFQQVPNTGGDGRFLDNFKGRLSGGGVRANLFECEIAFPSIVLPTGVTESNLQDKIKFLVKASALPASTINPISVPFRGRELKIAGDRTFEPWSVTVINDTDFSIRGAFERWINYMSKSLDNAGEVNPSIYQRDAWVYQLGRAPMQTAIDSAENIPVLRAYHMYGVFPTNVSPIPLSYADNSTIEEFTVDLQVQYFEAYNGAKGIEVQ
tara:strand:+ start:32 stop:661 length:630 start_codon:yes stop_codon:yes gene_type:complete